MSEFMIQVHFHCQSAENYKIKVRGSTGRTYMVCIGFSAPGPVKYEWQCECKGFKFRRVCKHVEAAKNDPAYCGWQQQIQGGEIVRDDNGVARCPKCNDLAIALRYAV